MKYLKKFNENAYSSLEEYKKGKSDSYGYKITKNIENPNDILNNISFIQGYLDLNNSKITKLPDNLEIDGFLSLSNTKIESLPNGLVVRGDLVLINCRKLMNIPSDLIVDGNLVLNNGKYIKDELKKSLPFVSNIIIMS